MSKTLDRENSSIFLSDKQSHIPALHELIKPHLQSFNSIFDDGLLETAVDSLDRRTMTDSSGNRIDFWLENVEVSKPLISEKEKHSLNRFLYPSECRERGVSYKGRITATLCWSINSRPAHRETKTLGYLPIMVKSSRCHLNEMSPKALVQHHEEPEELGGYFIVNGIERIIRLLIVSRRNHVLALIRPSFTKRGPLYTQFGSTIRCVREDQTSQTITLHYLSDGNCMFRFHYRKSEYLLPAVLILKALIPTTDKEIYESILQDSISDAFIAGRVENMLRDFKKFNLNSQSDALGYIGSCFRVVLDVPKEDSDQEVGVELMRRVVFVHLEKPSDKFNLLIFMIRKLYSLVSNKSCADNPDAPMHQELLLPGYLYLASFKEKLDEWLSTIKATLAAEIKKDPAKVNLIDDTHFKKVLAKVSSDLGRKLEYFLATGNLVSSTGLDLQQATGYTIVAEKLNFLRYIAHFRSVHRGAFFATLKTTTVRKLQPDAWGFLCPVHTPDGSPCGLLNHLSHSCKISTKIDTDTSMIPTVLASIGMIPYSRGLAFGNGTHISVLLDGKLIGVMESKISKDICAKLRYLKMTRYKGIPDDIETAFIPTSNGGLFPGLYIFSTPSRFVRPVRYLGVLPEGISNEELIGPLEQIYLDIAVKSTEIIPNVSTHMEISATNILSVVANLTPFCNFNQSPRNMYQCQMAKQSIGTPMHSYPKRTDNKLYRLTTGQAPIVRPSLTDTYGTDNYPNGTNAIVCVISYTGYDMEDAMILNKSSFERGFGAGMVYKSEFIDISELKTRGEAISHFFDGSGLAGKQLMTSSGSIETDGLPLVGMKIRPDEPLYAVINTTTGTARIERFKGFEEAYVDQVRLIGDDAGELPLQKIHIKFRFPRPPIIGDKFSSRHGQKGVCSQKWPQIDMPFTESGLTPDVIINPHAFPSRMTIGMFVESIAAKAGALHGFYQDATPFQFSEENTAADFFGEQLLKAGYNYHGNEPMYSGIMGTELRADIYIGIVYYQRLRHMVSDKFQVRTTGPVHNLTQQPVKGRKRAGGIRFGEMERDSLLAHGVSFLLQDRLMNCSDYCHMHVCKKCGSILSPISYRNSSAAGNIETLCRLCESASHIDTIAMPYVFRYLATELMAMNIKVTLNIE